MADTLHAKIADLHVFLYGGLRSLPFALGGTLLMIGLFTSNYAILFFLIGLLIIAPLGAWAVNHIIPIIVNSIIYLGSFITGNYIAKPTSFLDIPYFKTRFSDVCKLIIPFSSSSTTEEETIISSGWTAMTAFFIGYVTCNALQLYSNDVTGSATLTEPNAPDTQMKVNKRKSQAMFALVSIAIFALDVKK